jgi:hypothetical protein
VCGRERERHILFFEDELLDDVTENEDLDLSVEIMD